MANISEISSKYFRSMFIGFVGLKKKEIKHRTKED